SRIVRLPLNKVGLTNRINKAFQQLEQEYEREPSAEELAEILEIDTEEIAATLGVAARHVSMDTPLSEGEDGTLVDIMANPNADSVDERIAHHESLKKEIERSLHTLTDRQQDVLRFFFGIGIDNPMSLEDIGERFNLTRERVRQIKDKAITKLRTASRSKLLKTYLGT
ncbi:MAG: RNA polymerase subunit sigma, partial [Chitinophagaceae bacterium]|nr:RNA polymerase subunit sigma [Chitinophagaceae bacterium]